MGLEIELLDSPIKLRVGDFQRDRLIVEAVGLFVALGCIRLLHEVGGILQVIYLLLLEELDLLVDRLELLGLAIVAFIAMAAYAAAVTEEALAGTDHIPCAIGFGEHHVGGVAGLASGLDVLFGEHRP